MSLPGVPGQGVLTILLGVMLLDFPGKRNLETRLVRQPRVFRSINALRARFDKPPLILDEETEGAGDVEMRGRGDGGTGAQSERAKRKPNA
jgi:hypothetical protein